MTVIPCDCECLFALKENDVTSCPGAAAGDGNRTEILTSLLSHCCCSGFHQSVKVFAEHPGLPVQS